jgi:hypothetical protein
MRKLIILVATILFSFFSFPIAHALPITQALPIAHDQTAANSTITLFEPTHRVLDGRFIDDDLATLLDFNGRLGSLIFQPPRGQRIWLIDAALVEEVIAMSRGYSLITGDSGAGTAVAQEWLKQLSAITLGDLIYALPYGNPSWYWIHRLSPHDQNYFLTAGQGRLTTLLARPVNTLSTYPARKYFQLEPEIVEAYKNALLNLQITAIYMPSTQLDNFRLHAASILTASLEKTRREFLARNLTAESYAQIHNVRIVPGRFTVTSAKQELPITIINDFSINVKVNLVVVSLNGKVLVKDIPPITLAANSKTQVLVPITVLTSGIGTLSAGIMTPNGEILGDSVLFPLTLSVISPIATWITTGAAVTLFMAAIIQSIRRIRRNRQARK